jgi:uncharacterized protein YneF (UPF0154 family)
MVHPNVRIDPMLRERYGIKDAPRSNLWLAILFTLICLIWFFWSGSNIANPQVRSELISFKVIDDQTVSVTYTIKVKDLTTEHSCNLVARDIAKNVVGEINDSIVVGQLQPGKNQRTIEIPTRTPAVNAGISSCQ